MNAVTLGPFMFSAERFSALLALIAFVTAASVIGRFVHKYIHSWSSWTIVASIVSARAVHVITHWESFTNEPLRIFAVWQGGFAWQGLALGLATMLFVLARRDPNLLKWGLVCISVSAIAFAGSYSLNQSAPSPKVPATIFSTISGDPLSLSDRTQPMVLNLWATWCPPCRREMPMMAETAASRSDVDFIFANQGEASGVVGAYLQQHSIALRHPVLDHESALLRHYAIPGLPATLFISPEGQLLDSHLGEISPETFKSKIENLVQQKVH